MKKLLIIAIVLIITSSSCTRFIVNSSAPSGCGAWHPKKFKA